jgi:type IV pilus assembly protein PilA
VELLIVVIILGVLSSVALPAFLNQQKKGVMSSLDATAMAAAKSCAALQVTGEIDSFSAPSSSKISLSPTTCPNAGTAVTFTASDTNNPARATPAEATLGVNGEITLVSAS